jgi:hypothetical protein
VDRAVRAARAPKARRRRVSHTCVVKFAPIFTAERFNDAAWNRPGRTMYERHAFQFLPGKTTAPLLIDHDREIGTVESMFLMDWVDGPWMCAKATVDAGAPTWLQRGARASFEYRSLDTREYNIRGTKADVVAKAMVSEVSVLSPSTKPAEPLAAVLSYRPADPPAAGRSSSGRRPAAGNVVSIAEHARSRRTVMFTDTEIRRRIDEAARTGHPDAIEMEIAHMQRLELGTGFSLDDAYRQHIAAKARAR